MAPCLLARAFQHHITCHITPGTHLLTPQGQTEMLLGMFNILAAVGVLFAGPVSDSFGRKRAMMLGSVLFLIGTLFVTIGVGFSMMFFGRCVNLCPPLPLFDLPLCLPQLLLLFSVLRLLYSRLPVGVA